MDIKCIKTENLIFSLYSSKNKNKQTNQTIKERENIQKYILKAKKKNNKKIRKAIRFGTLFILNSLPKIYCNDK